MRKLTYFIASTLDGFIAAPDYSFGAFPVVGDHISVIATQYPETLPTPARAALGVADAPNVRFDTCLMGRRTYEPGLAAGVPSPYAHLRQFVFSRTLPESDDVTIVSTDPVEKVRELKREHGSGIWLCGGSELATQLLSEIDELIVKIYPLVFGSGIPLFSHGYRPDTFEYAESQVSENGVAFLHYRRPVEARSNI